MKIIGSLISLTILGCTMVGIHDVVASLGKFGELGNIGTKFDTYIAEYSGLKIATCLIACASTNSCAYVSYNTETSLCQTHGENVTVVSMMGWNMFYKVKDDNGFIAAFDVMTGANASQSTTRANTMYTFSAELALDGNPNGYVQTCAITNNSHSFWIMQFGTPGVIDKVDIHLRSDYVGRNTNRTVLVAQTYDNADNDVGTECGRYFGPKIGTPFLLTIKCSGPLYGSFLKISFVSTDLMEICEVVVYSP